MDLTDRQKQVISGKRLLTDREKRAQIKKWDLEVWTAFAPPITGDVREAIEYHCICPHCSHEKSKKKDKQRTHNLTAWVFHHANGDGLGFYCAACKKKHPRVFKFLGGAGAKAAEEYAEKRLEIDAVGRGWYCPNPQRKERDKRSRAAQHKAADERRKKENKVAYALREQEALKAAEPQTPQRPKGSCSVSKDEAARERERFASRPVRRSQGS